MPPEQIIRAYVDSYNAKDIERMLGFVTEDVVFENISNTGQSMRQEGKARMGDVAELSGRAFSYRRQKILSLLVTEDGKGAAAEIEFDGKAAVDLPDGTKAGEAVKLRGASFFSFKDGKLSRIADYS